MMTKKKLREAIADKINKELRRQNKTQYQLITYIVFIKVLYLVHYVQNMISVYMT